MRGDKIWEWHVNLIYFNSLLIHNTDSLLYKVFKAKYFSHCTILDEEVKMKGSYAWQSILKARSLVHTGSTWRIGNGEKVLIRGDNWLLDQFSKQVISPQKTSQIILMSAHSWMKKPLAGWKKESVKNWCRMNSSNSRNFFEGVPQQAHITQFNKKKNLYIDNNNNKEKANI